MKKLFPIAFPLVLVVVFLAFFAPGCEKDSISVTEDAEGGSPVGWMEPSAVREVPSRIYILSEGIAGSREPSGYRIQGTIKDGADLSKGHPYTSIELGGLTILPLSEGEVAGNPAGLIQEVFSPQHNEEEWAEFQRIVGNEVTLKINDENGLFGEQTIAIAPPLRASIRQEGVSIYERAAIDKTQALTISWPTDRLETRSETLYEDQVGATIVYSPKETARRNEGGDFPTHSFSREFLVPFDYGSITFTADDLALFPSNGMVTIYVGSIRYRVDANGNLVTATSGGATVISGGTSGTPYIRVNIP